MNKFKVVIIIVSCIVASLLADVLFGNTLSAKLSTVRLFNRFQIVKPNAPIVINKKEEVRVSDTADIINAVDKAKSKVSLLVYKSEGTLKVSGGAINLTSDGFFISAKAALTAAGTNKLSVLTTDGKTFPITNVFTDSATNLVLLKAEANGISVADFGKPEDLSAGQRIAFVSGSGLPHASRFTASFVSFPQNDTTGQVFDSDRPSQSFGVQGVSGIFAGQAVVNLAGEVIGIFDGVTVISASTIKPSANAFVEKKSSISRPAYGFKYRILGQTESNFLSLPQGAQVTKSYSGQPAVTQNSPASQAGLAEGDIITSVGDVKVDVSNTLEALLQKYKSGDSVEFSISRNNTSLKITIKPASL